MTPFGARELGADIAILELTQQVDPSVPRYDIYRNTAEIDQVFTRVGFGRTGTGATGSILGTAGTKHAGMNRFDGEASSLNAFQSDLIESFVASYIEGTYLISDFDDGTPTGDTLGHYGIAADTGLLGAGTGPLGTESMSAASDSGGPLFIGNRIAGVTSHSRYSLSNDPGQTVRSNFTEIVVDTRVSHYAAWIDSVIDIKGARVTSVTVSGSDSQHAPYTLPSGSGEQLRTVPVGAADTFTLTFSEGVNVDQTALQLFGPRTGNRPVPVPQFFTHATGSNTVSWRFTGFATGDQYALMLDDVVTDLAGVPLDGEWTNPSYLFTPAGGALGKFPAASGLGSRDGSFGGDLSFVLSLMPGDANLDLMVDVGDLGILGANWNIDVGRFFVNADFTGNGDVDVGDLSLLGANYNKNWQTLFILADLDGDYDVDADDLAILQPHLEQPGTWDNGDLNGDGQVTQADLDIFNSLNGVRLMVL